MQLAVIGCVLQPFSLATSNLLLGLQCLNASRYSWGACLAAAVAQLPSVHGYLGISPPVGKLLPPQLFKKYIQ